VVARTQAHYRMIDKRLWCMKIVDYKSDEMYAVSMDVDGNIVDEGEIKEQEIKAYTETQLWGLYFNPIIDHLRPISSPFSSIFPQS